MRNNKDPFAIIHRKHVTEKASTLGSLCTAESNMSVRRCKSPKYVFVVDKLANKAEIASAVEEIYRERNIKVTKVNTINVKSKQRRYRGRIGNSAGFKKAIVTLEEGDTLQNT